MATKGKPHLFDLAPANARKDFLRLRRLPEKRLAVKVEAHPLEYVNFEAVIPDGNYGAGPMICWDRGQFRPLVDPTQGILDGEIKFELWGYKLRGAFTPGAHRP
ncbi:MAG: hypothetical protein HC870_00115, partial [Rhizobiales bacterium]|nr:hypothetical protein [Hyphomicrobiales bacterium]